MHDDPASLSCRRPKWLLARRDFKQAVAQQLFSISMISGSLCLAQLREEVCIATSCGEDKVDKPLR